MFKFNSIINRNYCYIEFDSRDNVIRWEKRLVKKMDLKENFSRRTTRSMTKAQRNIDQNVHRLGVASLPSENNVVYDDEPSGDTYDNILELFENVSEKKSTFDQEWLSKKGFVKNIVEGHKCYICLDVVKIDDIVFNI